MKYGERIHRRSFRYQNLLLGLHRIGVGLSSLYLLGTLMLCYLHVEPKRRVGLS